MSLEELPSNELELRDLITERLSKFGLINEIKAQLRAGVLLTLSQEKDSRIPIYNQKKKLQNIVNNIEGKLAISLVKDLIEQLNLKHTLSVFELEAGIEELELDTRDTLIKNFQHIVKADDRNYPILFSLLKNFNSTNHDLSDKDLIQGSNANSSGSKNKRVLPLVTDQKEKGGFLIHQGTFDNFRGRISYKSDDSNEFSDANDITDFSGKKNTDTNSKTTRIPKFTSHNQRSSSKNSEKVSNPYQTSSNANNKGFLNNEISYEDSFSDKSSTTKHNDEKSEEDSIKEVDFEEIDEASESKTGDVTIDSERSLSLDYMELAKKKY